MRTSKPRWLHRTTLRRGIVPLLVLTLALPAVGIASIALFDSSLAPWSAPAGAGESAGGASIWLPVVVGNTN